MSSLEFKIDVFAALAAKLYLEFIGLVSVALPRRLNKRKVRALLSWQLMVSVLVRGHVNSIRRIASGWDFCALCIWGCWLLRILFWKPEKWEGGTWPCWEMCRSRTWSLFGLWFIPRAHKHGWEWPLFIFLVQSLLEPSLALKTKCQTWPEVERSSFCQDHYNLYRRGSSQFGGALHVGSPWELPFPLS